MNARTRSIRVPSVLFVFVASACSVVNDIDVCRRDGSVPARITATAAGLQAVASPESVAALPVGGHLTVIHRFLAAGDQLANDIVGRVILPDGRSMSSCIRTDFDTQYVQPEDGVAFFGASVVAPQSDAVGSLGLLVFVRVAGDVREASPTEVETWIRSGPSEVWGAFIDADGCLLRSAGGGAALFSLSADAPGRTVLSPPRIVGLGDNRFAVTWTAGDGEVDLRSRLLVRTVHARIGMPLLLSDLRTLDTGLVVVPAVTQAEPGRLAVAWQRFLSGEQKLETRLALLDDSLEPGPGEEVWRVGQVDAETGSAQEARLAVASDRGQLLVVWPERDAEGHARVVARFRGLDGRPLRSEDSPDGAAFRLSRAADGEELHPVVVPVDGGGFLVAWIERDVARRGARGSRIRMRGFDAAGRRRFLDPACGFDGFTLAELDAHEVRDFGLALDRHGSLAVAWTASASDRVEMDVHARVFDRRELFPLE